MKLPQIRWRRLVRFPWTREIERLQLRLEALVVAFEAQSRRLDVLEREAPKIKAALVHQGACIEAMIEVLTQPHSARRRLVESTYKKKLASVQEQIEKRQTEQAA